MKTWKIGGLALLMFTGLVACEDSTLEESTDAASERRSGDVTTVEGDHMRGPHGPDFIQHLTRMGNQCEGRQYPEGAEVTGDEGAYPRTVTVNFEGKPPRGPHKMANKVREMVAGKSINITMTVEKSDDLREEGAVWVIRPQATIGGDMGGSGEITLTNQGKNGAGEWVIAMEGMHSRVGPRGTFSRSFEGTKTWKAGFETEDCSDDLVWVTGMSEGTGPDDREMSATVVEPLVLQGECKHPVSGVVRRAHGDEEVVVDFGDGTCDGTITVTRDGTTEEIDLEKCRAERGEE